MASPSIKGEDHHVVMLPFMAQGHLIPFLALAKLIVHRHSSITIHLASTPLNVRSLEPLLPSGNAGIRLHALPFNSADHDLPPGAENTDSLSFPAVLRFFPATESLQPHFDQLIAELTRRHGRPPAAIIGDVFTAWSLDTAREHNIFHATFTTCGGYGTAAYFSIYLHRPHAASGAAEFNLPGFPDSYRLRRDQLSVYLRDANGDEPWFKFNRRQISLSLRSDAMLCNTAAEVETDGLLALRRVAASGGGSEDNPIWPVGPLLPLEPVASSSAARAGRTPTVGATECTEWLDAHPPASVVYVSFGSQNSISVTQMAALAAGLEGSRCPFIWVVRPPFGFDVKGEFRDDEWLPEGFEEKVGRRRGMVVRGWAPQLEILSHPSTAAFVSHCGWNSVLESLSRGVPIVGWPLASDQFYNAKMVVEELRAGVELARGVEVAVDGGAVERVIRAVAGPEGREMRERAAVVKGKIRAAVRAEGNGAAAEEIGSSLRAVDEFIATVALEESRRAERVMDVDVASIVSEK